MIDEITDIQNQILEKYNEEIERHHFIYIDGEPTLDGMAPLEWADAMFGE